MNNEKGLTLIEIIVALSIGVVVLSVVFMTFSAMRLEWVKTTQTFNDNATIRTTLHTISELLADSAQIYYAEEDAGAPKDRSNELRMRNGADSDHFKSLYYDGSKKTLTLCDQSDEFTTSTPIPCVDGIQLAGPDHMAKMPQYYLSIRPANEKAPLRNLLDDLPQISQGKLVMADFYFYRKTYDVRGRARHIPKSLSEPTDSIQIKLLRK